MEGRGKKKPMRLKDALFNWLQIRVVWDARPQDRSAEDTTRFFHDMLIQDHGVEELEVTKDAQEYVVRYRLNGEEYTERFHREQVEDLLKSIQSEPKYNQSFE
jgi:hypothetical protein